jgi:hypothetical protein
MVVSALLMLLIAESNIARFVNHQVLMVNATENVNP